ncbi:putative nuclease HARBI1 [Pseudorasbora parva]|uniref:putative nuclease HARBI1 n=1 Tax=Pseudorasbora parva TaxID=51549 RepID=UPI00351EB940
MAEFIDPVEDVNVPRRIFRDRENPLDHLSDEKLLREYRFDRRGIYEIANKLEGDLDHVTQRNHSLPSVLQLLIALRFFATGSFQSVVGDVFHVHKSSVSRVIHRVAGALCRHLSQTVTFPSRVELDAIQTSFFRKAGFPRISGVIDGTHVRIQAPRTHEDQYVNRKNYHSVNVQLVCDHLCRIRNVVASWPGSTHDSRILTESKIGRDFEAGMHGGLLLGDSGYPCRPWLMTPFMNPLNAAQERYNNALTHTRSIIERTIGQLKRRFHCLHSELRVEPPRACRIIVASVVLFNMSKMYSEEGDDVEEEAQEAEEAHEENQQDFQRAGFVVRDAIVNAFFN